MSLLDAEPELARRLPPGQVVEARRRSVVPVLLLTPGRWEPPPQADPVAGCEPLGFMILQGLLARDERLAGRTSTELAGPGDLIQPLPSPAEEHLLPRTVVWTVFEPAMLAVLTPRFGAAIRRWPEILAALLERAMRHSQRLATQQAICQLSRVEDRVLMLFWHLAERWGRVVPGGIAVSLPLSHEAIGHLIGAKRSTVTVALGRLCERGHLDRRPDGTFLLSSGPPVGRSLEALPSPPPEAPALADLRSRGAVVSESNTAG